MTDNNDFAALTAARPKPVPGSPEAFRAEAIEIARNQLETLADEFDVKAEKILKLYQDISMNGEGEAFLYRKVASDLRKRLKYLI